MKPNKLSWKTSQQRSLRCLWTSHF